MRCTGYRPEEPHGNLVGNKVASCVVEFWVLRLLQRLCYVARLAPVESRVDGVKIRNLGKEGVGGGYCV